MAGGHCQILIAYFCYGLQSMHINCDHFPLIYLFNKDNSTNYYFKMLQLSNNFKVFITLSRLYKTNNLTNQSLAQKNIFSNQSDCTLPSLFRDPPYWYKNVSEFKVSFSSINNSQIYLSTG